MSFIIGLTGGIASGKSTIAQMFRNRSIDVFNADAYVHSLISVGGEAVAEISETFPSTIEEDGSVNRFRLGAIVFDDEAALAQLEAILHPKVRKGEEDFIAAQREEFKSISVLEVPLLYETRADALCDMTVVADCDPQVQYERAMQREGMTEEKFGHIVARQLPREVRSEKANLVINTEAGEETTRGLVNELIDTLLD